MFLEEVKDSWLTVISVEQKVKLLEVRKLPLVIMIILTQSQYLAMFMEAVMLPMYQGLLLS